MPERMSAVDHNPTDFIREVSMEALEFYRDGLSGLFLPEDFKTEHGDVFDVRLWDVSNRLQGKFGRFVMFDVDEQPVDLLLMGTTIALGEVDGYPSKNMNSLRHFELMRHAGRISFEIGHTDPAFNLQAADYGGTTIEVEDGQIISIKVERDSIDFGRSDTEGRGATCALFEELLGRQVEVDNVDPDPRERQRTIPHPTLPASG